MAIGPLLLATLALAASGPRCPQGRQAALTGHPLRPLDCLASSELTPAAAPDEKTLPDARDASRADLKALDGLWRGVVTTGGSHYELELEISGSGRELKWSAQDMRTLQKGRLDASIKSGLWAKAPYKFAAASPDFPDFKLAGLVWLGAARAETGKPPLDRAAAWTFTDRPQRHAVRFALDGDSLRGVYALVDPKTGGSETPFELKRAKR